MLLQETLNKINKTYAPLTPAAQQAFLEHATILTPKKQTILVKEGDYSDKIYYIVEGSAKAYYLKEGKEIADWFAFENEFISSIVSFFTDKPSPHYIELLEDSILVEFSRDKMEELAEKYHDFEHLVRVVITKKMLRHQERIASMQFYDAENKYKNLLAIRPDITQRVPLTDIASYIGITLETLSRIRKPQKRI